MKEFAGLVWKWRTRAITIWIVVMLLVLVRLLTMDNVYTSSCLLTPLPLEQVDEQSQSGLAGATVRSLIARGGSRDEYTVLAYLQSRQLADAVVNELHLDREFFPERWDDEKKEWRERRGGKPEAALSRRALNGRVDVSYDEFTGLIQLDVHWWSPERAKEVADAYVESADRLLRDAAVSEGERRVEELEREMANVAVGDVGAYLAEEMTRAISSLTSIRARSRYAFRVIDPPLVPHRKSWPPRFLLLLLTAFATAAVELGFIAGIYLRRREARGADGHAG